jgi:hypothetical protein
MLQRGIELGVSSGGTIMSAVSTRLFVPVFLVLAAILPQPSAQTRGEQVLLGAWQLDLTKSTYFPGPAPRSETRSYTADANGVLGVIKRTHANGRVETIEWRADYDREQAVTGTPAYNAIVLKRIDDLTAESTLSHAGIVYGTARRVISADGNTLTITFQRKTADETIRNIAVYHRVRK